MIVGCNHMYNKVSQSQCDKIYGLIKINFFRQGKQGDKSPCTI